MQDRYLFRGKSCIGNWAYGYLKKQLVGGEPDVWAIQSYKGCELKNQSGYSGTMKLYENVIDPATVGQCTGLRDKNGTLIFEDDIVRSTTDEEEQEIYRITFENFRWELRSPIYDYQELADFVNEYTTLEIIGNIHDNPELLERSAFDE